MAVGKPVPNVEHVEVTGPRSLRVKFDDGVQGTVRFEESYFRGAFEKLSDPDYFKSVGIAWGAVSWPNEEPDMAPDAMHDNLIAANGDLILS